jgi:hypothetical protein
MGFSSMQRIKNYSMITSPWKTGAERPQLSGAVYRVGLQSTKGSLPPSLLQHRAGAFPPHTAPHPCGACPAPRRRARAVFATWPSRCPRGPCVSASRPPAARGRRWSTARPAPIVPYEPPWRPGDPPPRRGVAVALAGRRQGPPCRGRARRAAPRGAARARRVGRVPPARARVGPRMVGQGASGRRAGRLPSPRRRTPRSSPRLGSRPPLPWRAPWRWRLAPAVPRGVSGCPRRPRAGVPGAHATG